MSKPVRVYINLALPVLKDYIRSSLGTPFSNAYLNNVRFVVFKDAFRIIYDDGNNKLVLNASNLKPLAARATIRLYVNAYYKVDPPFSYPNYRYSWTEAFVYSYSLNRFVHH